MPHIAVRNPEQSEKTRSVFACAEAVFPIAVDEQGREAHRLGQVAHLDLRLRRAHLSIRRGRGRRLEQRGDR
jgi:hypothetical protein